MRAAQNCASPHSLASVDNVVRWSLRDDDTMRKTALTGAPSGARQSTGKRGYETATNASSALKVIVTPGGGNATPRPIAVGDEDSRRMHACTKSSRFIVVGSRIAATSFSICSMASLPGTLCQTPPRVKSAEKSIAGSLRRNRP